MVGLEAKELTVYTHKFGFRADCIFNHIKSCENTLQLQLVNMLLYCLNAYNGENYLVWLIVTSL